MDFEIYMYNNEIHLYFAFLYHLEDKPLNKKQENDMINERKYTAKQFGGALFSIIRRAVS